MDQLPFMKKMQEKCIENGILKTVKKTSIFPASKKKVFDKLLKLRTLQYIAYPYATFTPLDGTDNMSWEVGSTSRFKFRLFVIIPFGTHTINVIRFGLDEGIYTHEGKCYFCTSHTVSFIG